MERCAIRVGLSKLLAPSGSSPASNSPTRWSGLKNWTIVAAPLPLSAIVWQAKAWRPEHLDESEAPTVEQT